MKDYVKSPLNYTGGKFKQIKFLRDRFPKDVSLFCDMFAGGGNVFINADAQRFYINEKNGALACLYRYLLDNDTENVIRDVERVIGEYDLSKENREGYMKLRKDYNSFTDTQNRSAKFLCLIFHSFNNQIRFGGKGNFNMSFGGGRSTFNGTIRSNLVKFSDRLKELRPVVNSTDFEESVEDVIVRHLENSEDGKQSLFYFDPPYANTNASYNRDWTDEDLRRLLRTIDRISSLGYRFALSETLIYKGGENTTLVEWADRNSLNIHHVESNFNNCSYHCRNRDGKLKTDEVLITNY